MKTYLLKETANKIFTKELYEIKGEESISITKTIDQESVRTRSIFGDDFVELKRLHLIIKNGKIVLNFQDEYVSPIMSSNIMEYDNRNVCIDGSVCNIYAGHYSSEVDFYYKTSNFVIFVSIYNFSDSWFNEEYLYDEDKIKKTFYMYLDKKNKKIYDEVIFKILNTLYPQNAYSLEKVDERINYTINKNKIKIELPDGRKGIAKCHPKDKFDLDEGLKIAFLRAINKEYILED